MAEPEDSGIYWSFPSGLAEGLFHFAYEGYFAGYISSSMGPSSQGSVLSVNPFQYSSFLTSAKLQQDSSPYPGTTFRQYDDDKIETISNSVSAILGSLLPTIAILVLYFVKRMLLRIGLVIVFTSIFSLALSLFTDAKRVEIFSATAA